MVVREIFLKKAKRKKYEPLYNACYQLQFQKILMARCGKKIINVDLGTLKMSYLPHYKKKNIFLKKLALSISKVY